MAEAPWWEAYRDVAGDAYLRMVECEQGATEIRQYQSLLVPGLLQTCAYMQEVVSSSALASQEPLIELRLRRQEILVRDDCPKMSFLIDEAVLHRGPPAILQAQLFRMERLSATAPVTIRVMPAMLLTTDCPFAIFDPFDYVYCDTTDGGYESGKPGIYRWRFGEWWEMAVPLEQFT